MIGTQIAAEKAEEIRNLRDPEAAHSMEDDLHLSILRTIAEGVCMEHAQELARIALRLAEDDFPRWCA